MTEEQNPESGVLEELHALGLQLSTAVKALWDSDDSRKLRAEIGDGFVELGDQVDSAIRSAQESEAAKQFGDQVKEAVDKARESDLAANLEEGLITGLQELNKGLSQLVGSLEPRETPTAAAEDKAETEEQGEPEA